MTAAIPPEPGIPGNLLDGQSCQTIAAETGYSDPCCFSRAFKKVMGLSPGKYRAIKKG